MSQKCIVNCKDNPDSVEKINWKCVECKRDLKADFDRIIAERKAAAEAKAKEVEANKKPGLSKAEIEKRRELQNV